MPNFTGTATYSTLAANVEHGSSAVSGSNLTVAGVFPSNGQFRLVFAAKTALDAQIRVPASADGIFWIGRDLAGHAILSACNQSQVLSASTPITAARQHYELIIGPTGSALVIDGTVAVSLAGAPYRSSDIDPTFLSGPLHFLNFFASTAYDWSGTGDELAIYSDVPGTLPAVGDSRAWAQPTAADANLIEYWPFDGDLNGVVGAAAASATAFTLTRSATTGPVGTPIDVTVSANGTFSGTKTGTLSGAGGTFGNASVSITSGTPFTTTWTPTSTGSKTIGFTGDGSLTNPASLGFTATAAPTTAYSQTLFTEPVSAQGCAAWVPNSNSAIPYNSANATPLIIHCHGASGDKLAPLDPLTEPMVTSFANAGCIVACSDAHGAAWGNQQSVDDYVSLVRYMRANYNIGPVVIWSISMGGLAGLKMIAQGRVSGIVGWLGQMPVCSLANLYSLSTYTSAINSAYGITGTAPATYAQRTPGHDPALFEATMLRHVPMMIVASAGDTTVPKTANADAIATLATGSTREVATITASGNHGDASHFSAPATYTAFVARCLARPVPTAGRVYDRPVGTKTVTIPLVDKNDATLPSLTGLTVLWYDDPAAALTDPPTDKLTGQATNSSGVLTVTVHSDLSAGGVGRIRVNNSDGTLAQSPAPRALDRVVAVS